MSWCSIGYLIRIKWKQDFQRTTAPSAGRSQKMRTLVECGHFKYWSASWYIASCHQISGHNIHYIDVIMTTVASQITSLTVVYSTVYSDTDKKNIKAPRHCPLCGEFTETGEFPAQRASYAEKISVWWRHHDFLIGVIIPQTWSKPIMENLKVPSKRTKIGPTWLFYIAIWLMVLCIIPLNFRPIAEIIK